ncbi:hypothetical protein [Actinomadura fibrosa]|uniref:Uncharacterized protein n=1 Tax=Actinomadura fibrosa TaxID=111802 RepID=A0ABW2XRC8_9ACTN|nr:hypothetical protein [Actinomadura fibrosa]
MANAALTVFCLGVAALLCLLVGGGFAWFAAGPFIAPYTDDPYFRHAACAADVEAKLVRITARGLPEGCYPTSGEHVRFTNLLAEPVTLCVGERGVCAAGHYSPFATGRVTLAAGESRRLRFPAGSHWAARYDRTYPVTVLPVSGSVFANADMKVRGMDESQPAVP